MNLWEGHLFCNLEDTIMQRKTNSYKKLNKLSHSRESLKHGQQFFQNDLIHKFSEIEKCSGEGKLTLLELGSIFKNMKNGKSLNGFEEQLGTPYHPEDYRGCSYIN